MVEHHDAVMTVVLAAGRDAPSRYAISGSCGIPGPMLESVSVALSTTIVMVSSSSSAVLASGVIGVLVLGLGVDAVVEDEERQPEDPEGVLGPQLVVLDVDVELLGEAVHRQAP